jgi:hypothetical protein
MLGCLRSLACSQKVEALLGECVGSVGIGHG